ncbi:MAG: hypothetical protein HWE13_02490 [Gammaproteobacteria bacterium]|nr:hypothetical protein [Gammaproteobacteria bacterium]NVK86962.1 hypothetical protein [Gammaproteobacteria bacterium]
MNKLVLASLCSAMASVYAVQPHQSLLDFAYGEMDEYNAKGERYRIQLPVKQGLYFLAAKTHFGSDDTAGDLNSQEIGGGIHWQTSDVSSMYLGYSKVDYELSGVALDEATRYAIGWRSRLSNEIEVNLEYKSTDHNLVDVDEAGYRVGAYYYMSQTAALYLELDNELEQDQVFFGVRFTTGH